MDLWKRNVLVKKLVSVVAKRVRNAHAKIANVDAMKAKNVLVRENSMKDKILWIIIALITLIVLGVILVFTAKKTTVSSIESLKSMHLSYSNGYSAYAYTRYDLYKKDDGYYLDIKPYGVPEDDVQTVKADEETVKKVLEVLNKYNVSKWDGFHKSDKYVLDGDSFSFSLYTEDDKNISASGYMEWPDNYSDVKQGIDDLLSPLYTGNRVYE